MGLLEKLVGTLSLAAFSTGLYAQETITDSLNFCAYESMCVQAEQITDTLDYTKPLYHFTYDAQSSSFYAMKITKPRQFDSTAEYFKLKFVDFNRLTQSFASDLVKLKRQIASDSIPKEEIWNSLLCLEGGIPHNNFYQYSTMRLIDTKHDGIHLQQIDYNSMRLAGDIILPGEGETEEEYYENLDCSGYLIPSDDEFRIKPYGSGNFIQGLWLKGTELKPVLSLAHVFLNEVAGKIESDICGCLED